MSHFRRFGGCNNITKLNFFFYDIIREISRHQKRIAPSVVMILTLSHEWRNVCHYRIRTTLHSNIVQYSPGRSFIWSQYKIIVDQELSPGGTKHLLLDF